jgi:nicotinamide riboside kinase
MSTAAKILITGGESTGKSTLCEQLAQQYRTLWVPEYARTYLQELDRPYEESDLVLIAQGQLSLEQAMHEEAHAYLFCDTGLEVIRVWSEHKYQRCDAWILDQLAQVDYAGSILTAPDFAWEPDPLREHPDPYWRQYFFRCYTDLLSESGKPFCVVSGSQKERLQQAIDFLQQLNCRKR